MTWLLKCDSGQSSCELTQGSAGLDTVWEAIQVYNGSRECTGYKKVKIFDFSEMMMMIYSNRILFDFEKHCDLMGEFWIRLCSIGLSI